MMGEGGAVAGGCITGGRWGLGGGAFAVGRGAGAVGNDATGGDGCGPRGPKDGTASGGEEPTGGSAGGVAAEHVGVRKSHVLTGGQQVWVASRRAQVSQRYWTVLLPGMKPWALCDAGLSGYTAMTGCTHI